MMRRLDVRPLKKLRNPGRHLRSLKRWATTAAASLPKSDILEQWSDAYLLIRIPITSKLVAPRHTTPEICRAVAQALLDAAGSIDASLNLVRPVRIACRIEPESLWDSTIYLIFDDAYFQSIVPPVEHGTFKSGDSSFSTAPAEMDLVADWALTLPEGFVDFGGYREIQITEGNLSEGHQWFFAEAAPRSHP